MRWAGSDLRRAAWPVILVALAFVTSGCDTLTALLPSPQPVAIALPTGALSPDVLADEHIDLSPVPDTLPAPAVTADQALATADGYEAGGDDRGRLLGVARGRAPEYVNDPKRTVWVVVYGPGGTMPAEGPAAGGQSPIHLQIVLVDDQTGAFLRSTVR
jgi:hypothetical protein